MYKTFPYHTTQLEDHIHELYESLYISIPEHINMKIIAKKLNIWLHFAPFGSRAICKDGLPSIIIDSRSPFYHQWEDFGHELCHILFHVGNQICMPKLFLEYQEMKASNFMLHFCVPTFMLRTLNLPEARQEAIYLIATTFNVSFHTAEQRLLHYEMKLLSSSHSQNFLL
ncbi:ImmA/IrrE family metallo-endopeptidase [Bacillus cereus]|uniref:ImmA/IrrE family metallo-endopeptidase n=1 Tax=Bacillus cereus TaxID=1396 RepID=UPI00094253CF|nr:ImmA/IrrE family metallo-endopeptidase [Bacillus cereus]